MWSPSRPIGGRRAPGASAGTGSASKVRKGRTDGPILPIDEFAALIDVGPPRPGVYSTGTGMYGTDWAVHDDGYDQSSLDPHAPGAQTGLEGMFGSSLLSPPRPEADQSSLEVGKRPMELPRDETERPSSRPAKERRARGKAKAKKDAVGKKQKEVDPEKKRKVTVYVMPRSKALKDRISAANAAIHFRINNISAKSNLKRLYKAIETQWGRSINSGAQGPVLSAPGVCLSSGSAPPEPLVMTSSGSLGTIKVSDTTVGSLGVGDAVVLTVHDGSITAAKREAREDLEQLFALVGSLDSPEERAGQLLRTLFGDPPGTGPKLAFVSLLRGGNEEEEEEEEKEEEKKKQDVEKVEEQKRPLNLMEDDTFMAFRGREETVFDAKLVESARKEKTTEPEQNSQSMTMAEALRKVEEEEEDVLKGESAEDILRVGAEKEDVLKGESAEDILRVGAKKGDVLRGKTPEDNTLRGKAPENILRQTSPENMTKQPEHSRRSRSIVEPVPVATTDRTTLASLPPWLHSLVTILLNDPAVATAEQPVPSVVWRAADHVARLVSGGPAPLPPPVPSKLPTNTLPFHPPPPPKAPSPSNRKRPKRRIQPVLVTTPAVPPQPAQQQQQPAAEWWDAPRECSGSSLEEALEVDDAGFVVAGGHQNQHHKTSPSRKSSKPRSATSSPPSPKRRRNGAATENPNRSTYIAPLDSESRTSSRGVTRIGFQ